MRVWSRTGLTLPEALVGAVVLVTGILALAGSAALTSRLIGRGWLATRAAMAASARVDGLRRVAASTVPGCRAPGWRDDSAAAPGLREHWQILEAGGPARLVRLVVRVTHPGGVSSDTVVAGVLCGLP